MYHRSRMDLNEILREGYTVDINSFISRGWQICNQNLGGFVGFFLVSTLINVGLSFIPVLGSIAAAVISGPLNAGNYIAAFKIAKQQPVTFNDFFRGFQNAYFVPIFLATLVIGLIVGLCAVPIVVAVLIGAQLQLNTSLIIILGLLFLIPAIYLSIAYSLAVPLIVGRRMEFWPAMEASRRLITRQWWGFFGFFLVLGLLNIAGLIPCGLGLLITVPLSACAIAAAYEYIVGLPLFDPSQVEGS